MKKLITLTALLLCAVVSTWADEAVIYYADKSANSITVNNFTIAITGNSGKNWSNGNGKITYSDNSYTTLKNSNGAQNTITCPDGYVATNITFYVTTNDDKTAGKLTEIDGTSCNDEVSSKKDYSNPTVISKDIANKSSFTFTFSTKQVCFIAVVTYKIVTNDPTLSFNTKAISMNVSPVKTSKNATFTLSGSNLTDGTYYLTIPSVAGLSVSPTSFTVADGAVNQEFTVTYTSTADVAEAVANITATVDKIEANVAVTYSSRASLLELAAISGATTWDFSKITANTESERYGDNGIKLSNETTPSITDDVVYENYNGIDYTLADDFDGTTIAFQGEFPIRKNSYCQNGTIHFKTSVPGTIIVKFSDTGTSASNKAVKRYLVVNGNTTEYWASRENNGTENPYAAQLNVTSGEIYVPAGDVTITGTAALVYSSVEFNATLPETTKVTVGEACYRTFASKYPLDFTGGVSGLKAYKATVSGSTVTFSEVKGKVPAKGGLLLKAAAQGEYTISVSADEPTEFNNALVGVIKATDKAAGIYVLMDGAQGVGFYKTVNTFEVGDNTAYLPADVVAGARTFIGFDEEGEATGIETIERVQTTDTFFNLNGQRVAAPQKGLYIVNGKIVILK